MLQIRGERFEVDKHHGGGLLLKLCPTGPINMVQLPVPSLTAASGFALKDVQKEGTTVDAQMTAEKAWRDESKQSPGAVIDQDENHGEVRSEVSSLSVDEVFDDVKASDTKTDTFSGLLLSSAS